MPEQNHSTEIGDPLQPPSFEQQQRRRMLIALGVLVVALISVLIKDRQYWFPPSPNTESETSESAAPAAVTSKTIPQTNSPKATARAATHARSKSKPLAKTKRSAAPQSDGSPVIIASNRAVLPPLEVEVVAGNQHRAVKLGDSSVKLDMQPSDPGADEQTSAPTQSQDNGPVDKPCRRAGANVAGKRASSLASKPHLSAAGEADESSRSGHSRSSDQSDGNIQGIQVLSGPAILSEAAREAVKQWHFKPYYQGGQPVETQARITVNFTISTY